MELLSCQEPLLRHGTDLILSLVTAAYLIYIIRIHGKGDQNFGFPAKSADFCFIFGDRQYDSELAIDIYFVR